MDTQGSSSLAGRSAVVTGAASGIGRTIALELAHRGAEVFVHTRSNREGLLELSRHLQEIRRELGWALADLSDPEALERFVDNAWETRSIDIWINNAGADVLTGDAAELSFDEKFERLWQVDVKATVRISRLVGERMKKRRRGLILNMGWDQAETGMAGEAGEMFAAAKGAIIAFTKSLAKSLAPGVRVNCLAPGWIKTQWGEQADNYWQERAERECLLGRWGTPEDVARVAAFLASDDAQFLNGQIIYINGGQATGQ